MAKSIIFKAEFSGNGIVNYDSNDQKFYYNKTKSGAYLKHGNVMFGKGRFTSHLDDGKEIWTKTNVISSDFVRHHMFADEMSVHMPNVMHNDGLLIHTIANKAALERGYLFAKSETWKRKSPFQISYLKNTNPETVSTIETYSNSQAKVGSEDQGGTSFFMKEVIGDALYSTVGFIDLSELGMISLSEIHDRMALNPDLSEVYRKYLSDDFGSPVDEVKFWTKKTDIYQVPERGIKLSDEQVMILVKDIFRRLCQFAVYKNGGYVAINSLKILPVNDPTMDTATSEDGWITIKDGNQIDLSVLDSLSIHSVYQEVTDQDEKNKYEEYKSLKAKVKEKKPSKKSNKAPADVSDDSSDDPSDDE